MKAMTRISLALLTAFALTLSGAARAQETFESLGGTWWFKLGGKDKGALLIQFTTPIGGNFLVDDVAITSRESFGFLTGLGAFFVVATGQELTIDSKGNPVGELELSDPVSEEVLATLTFEKGKPNKKFTKWNLQTTLAAAGAEPLKLKLSGQRLPDNFPVLSGANPTITLSGQQAKSKAYGIAVVSDEELGLPAYAFVGAGPAEIDKVEVPNATIGGRFMLTPKYELVGLLEESSDFGTGPVSGKLKLPTNSLVPKLDLKAQADRKITVKGPLTEPVEAVLSVTPGSFEFPPQRLNDPNGLEQTFSVSNVGADDSELTGSATWLSGGPPDFTIEGESTYGPLTPNDDPNEIVVTFNPATRGNKTAQLLFGVNGGAGARIVTLTGQGGIADIRVDIDSIEFDDTTVNQSRFETVSVHNDGDGVLNGSVSVNGDDEFAIFRQGSTNPDSDGEIEYEIDPGATFLFTVRFRPSDDTDFDGTLTFTGGGGETVTLSGTGIP